MSNTLWPAPVQSVLECKIPHELDALKWKATGRRRRRRRRRIVGVAVEIRAEHLPNRSQKRYVTAIRE
jgi:hypothetical protein